MAWSQTGERLKAEPAAAASDSEVTEVPRRAGREAWPK